MARAQPLSISQSDSAFSHICSSSHQEVINHELASLTTSSTSPKIPSPLSPPSLMETSTSIDSIDVQSPSPFTSDVNGLNILDATPNTAQTPDVDPQIIEALKSKDRIYVLKLGETFESLIKERRARVDLSPATSYQRLLVHRCSAYYKLVPENDPVTKGIFVLYTVDSRIPERRISDLVPAESTTQPAFKIMRRSATERRSKPQSQTGSIAGEDADLSDLEPSESGSQGGRSNATGGSSKKRMTIEEREAAYNKARSRIFNKFEELGKDKDMSASSSLSGSTSNSASTDEPTSSPATAESEWSTVSGPRDKKDNRRGNASGPHSGSIRSGASFNGSGSSRNSRAPSPSFTYATLYEPPPSGPIYDPSQHHGHPSAGYYPNQPMYSFPSPGQGPTPPPFTPMYPYYPPYNTYQPPLPHPQYNPSDPSTPSTSEPFPSPHQMNYGNYYGWPHHPNQPPLQSPPHTMHHPPPSHQYPNHLNGPPPPHSPPYQTFMTPSQPHPYPYPVNGQFAPSSGPYISAPPHMNIQPQQQPYEAPRPMNGNTMGHQPDFHLNHGGSNGGGLRNGLGNGVFPPNSNGRPPVSRSVGPGMISNGNGVNGGKSRPPIPPPARSAWSYGPGVGTGGYVVPNGTIAGDAIGPRLSSGHRRPSGNSTSSNSRASSNCDEVSSTASSSTTSSSSRRTYTSTTSSQHPLPARPDWAVGIKAQPTLAAGRVHEQQHSLANSRTISPILPPWSNGNSPIHHTSSSSSSSNNLTPQLSYLQQQQTTPFQSTDFPPLTPITPSQEKRALAITGAWGASRPILSSTNGNGNGLVNGSTNGGTAHNSPISRLEETERGAERPVGKIGELYDPKSMRRPVVNANNGQSHQRTSSVKEVMAVKNGEVTINANSANANILHNASATLVGMMSTMSLENGIESIPTFRVGVEQEPTVTVTSST